jgi:hypothetical protein
MNHYVRKNCLKAGFAFTLLMGSLFAIFTGVSHFYLARECPWIPAWVFDTVSKASNLGAAIGIVSAIAAGGGVATVVVGPLILKYIKKHGLKVGLAL